MAHIAHFIDTKHAGGAERVVVDLCGRLATTGHTVEVFHFGNEWIAEYARNLGFVSVVLSHRAWYKSKWTVGPFALYMARILRERGIELLHSHLNGAIAAGAVAATLARIPHVGTLHDVFHVVQEPSRFRMLRLAALLGTRLVAVSHDMGTLYDNLSRGRIGIDCIYNGVEVDDFRRDVSGERAGFTFVSVGRLEAIKGFDILIDAFAQAKLADARLLIVGEGRDHGALEAQVARRGLEQCVEFLGFQADVSAVLAQADAFVLASRSEGLPCSVIEAMASSLPCIVSDVGGNRELVVDGKTGFLVPPGDRDTLAERLIALASDKPAARQMGVAGRRRVEDRFSLQNTVREYNEIYQSLLPAMGRA
ncbi:MAG: glycosyltransferase [Thiohalomonadaceae bacterium]